MPVKTLLRCHCGNRFPGRLSAPSLSTRSACGQSPAKKARALLPAGPRLRAHPRVRALLGVAADAGRGHVMSQDIGIVPNLSENRY